MSETEILVSPNREEAKFEVVETNVMEEEEQENAAVIEVAEVEEEKSLVVEEDRTEDQVPDITGTENIDQMTTSMDSIDELPGSEEQQNTEVTDTTVIHEMTDVEVQPAEPETTVATEIEDVTTAPEESGEVQTEEMTETPIREVMVTQTTEDERTEPEQENPEPELVQPTAEEALEVEQHKEEDKKEVHEEFHQIHVEQLEVQELPAAPMKEVMVTTESEITAEPIEIEKIQAEPEPEPAAEKLTEQIELETEEIPKPPDTPLEKNVRKVSKGKKVTASRSNTTTPKSSFQEEQQPPTPQPTPEAAPSAEERLEGLEPVPEPEPELNAKMELKVQEPDSEPVLEPEPEPVVEDKLQADEEKQIPKDGIAVEPEAKEEPNFEVVTVTEPVVDEQPYCEHLEKVEVKIEEKEDSTPPQATRRAMSPSPPAKERERPPSPPRRRIERSPSPPRRRPERSPSPPRRRPERSPSPVRKPAAHADRVYANYDKRTVGDTRPPPRLPAYSSFSSYTPVEINAYKPLSPWVNGSQFRSEYAEAYYPPSRYTSQFDDIVNTGAFSVSLYSANRLLERSRSRSRERRLAMRSQRSASNYYRYTSNYATTPIRTRDYSTPPSTMVSRAPSRSGSFVSFMDYSNAKQYELARDQSQSRLYDTFANRSRSNLDLFYGSGRLSRVDSYVRDLDHRYETNFPSSNARYRSSSRTYFPDEYRSVKGHQVYSNPSFVEKNPIMPAKYYGGDQSANIRSTYETRIMDLQRSLSQERMSRDLMRNKYTSLSGKLDRACREIDLLRSSKFSSIRGDTARYSVYGNIYPYY